MSLKWFEKIALVIFITCGFCCTKQIKSENQLTITDHKEDVKQGQETDTKTEGSEVINTTTDEQDDAIELQDQDGGTSLNIVTAEHPLKIPVGSKIIGSVPIRSKSIQVLDTKGPVIETKTSNLSESGSEDTGLKMDKVFTEAEKVSPWPSLWLIGLITGGIFVAAILVKKFTIFGKIVTIFQKFL